MNPKKCEISPEKYVELVAQITAGLLASGHFTNFGDGDPYAVYYQEKKSGKENCLAVFQAEAIVEEIIDRHDEILKCMGDD
jgi:hypothetical protein